MLSRMQWVGVTRLLDESPIAKSPSTVYLQTSPAVVHERMVRRARPEERAVGLPYLQQLHQLHEAMVERLQPTDPTDDPEFHVSSPHRDER